MLEVMGKVVMGCERCNGLIKPEPWMDYSAGGALTRERRWRCVNQRKGRGLSHDREPNMVSSDASSPHGFRSVGEDKTYCGARHAWTITSEKEVRQHEREGIYY